MGPAFFGNPLPMAEHEIENIVRSERASDEVCMKIIKKALIEILRHNAIPAEVTGRVKSLQSIFSKMLTARCSVFEVMDKIGMRIIVETVPECYRVLGLLHLHFKPIAGTFDDYIAAPKANGYQSLHTCVFPLKDVSHKPMEIQIRTRVMHREAEFGSAAHWRYKIESGSGFPRSRTSDRARALALHGRTT